MKKEFSGEDQEKRLSFFFNIFARTVTTLMYFILPKRGILYNNLLNA